ncbi:MAG: class B sortase [Bacilli bacterium]|nr:class B sortase [Bacilli bacterium]
MELFKNLFLSIKYAFIGIVTVFYFFIYGLYTVITIIPRYFIIGMSIILKREKDEEFNNKIRNLKKNKKLSLVIMVLCVEVYLICIFFISRWYVQGLKIKFLASDIIESTEIIENQEESQQQQETSENGVSQETPQETADDGYSSSGGGSTYYPNDYWDYMDVPFLNVDFDELLAKNSDTVGWIKVDGTKVNYPVVQTDDNDYYLHHAFNGSSNSAGWIFADYRVDFEEFGKNTIIYGHNMNNKTMFGSVPQMLNSSYLNNSGDYYIKISTPTCNTVWKMFSIYTVEPEIYYLKTNFITYSFEEFINTIKSRSVYDFGIDVTADDKILTLSTCDNTGTKRVAVHSKMINIEYK